MTADRCIATTKTGAPCSAQVWKDGLCRWHHPAMESSIAEGRRKGGKNASNAARARKKLTNDVRDLADVKARLMGAMVKVENGELEPALANSMAGLARAIAAISQVSDLEERLRRLEEKAGVRELA